MQPNPLSISGASVVPSNVVRNLGVYVDGQYVAQCSGRNLD